MRFKVKELLQKTNRMESDVDNVLRTLRNSLAMKTVFPQKYICITLTIVST